MSNSKKETEGFKTVDRGSTSLTTPSLPRGRKSARKKAQQPPTTQPQQAELTPPPQQEPPTDNAQPPVVSEVEPQQPPSQQEPQGETQAEEPFRVSPPLSFGCAQDRQGEPSEQVPAFDAYGALRWCIALLSAQAWQWMGLVANPTTGEVKKDLEQARLSVDSLAALVERLSPSVDADERRELQNLLSNLRLNFVNQSRPVQ